MVKNYNAFMRELNKHLNDSKVVVFLDFEGTQYTQEIIAIGAIKAVLDNKNQIKKTYPGFKFYVKATGSVGKIVNKLTGITDEKLQNEGLDFKKAMKLFEKYIGHHHDIKFITYGNFDMRLLHQSAVQAKINEEEFIKNIYKNYIDFSTILSHYVRSPQGTQLSLADALSIFQITPEGAAHDPLFDAKNLMFLYKALIKNKGILEAEYEKVLLNNHVYPAPITKIIKDLEKNGTATLSDLKKYIEEDL
jgi:DNA polymerase III, alpha subunit (gram-positive type)